MRAVRRRKSNAVSFGPRRRARGGRDRSFLMLVGSLSGALFVAIVSWPVRPTTTDEPYRSFEGFECRVSSVTDGDTLRCSGGTRIRLHAVAAREKDETCRPGHPCPAASGASATARLTELAAGQTLRCEQTGETYGRVAAICRNEADVEINCAMVESGTTLIWPKYDRQRRICQ